MRCEIHLTEAQLDDLAARVAARIGRRTGAALLTVSDLADHLNVSRRTVENLIRIGEIRPLWIGRQRRFDPASIDAYLSASAEVDT